MFEHRYVNTEAFNKLDSKLDFKLILISLHLFRQEAQTGIKI